MECDNPENDRHPESFERQRMRWSVLWSSLAFLTGCGVGEGSKGATLKESSRRVIDPMQLLEDLPSWCDHVYGSAEFDLLEDSGKEAAAYTLDELRAALVIAEDRGDHRDPRASSKMYVLMRVLFEVPESMPTRGAPVGLGTFLGHPVFVDGDQNKYAVGWPVEWTNGEITHVALCHGVKTQGVVYRAVEEFDAFRQLFPRRTF